MSASPLLSSPLLSAEVKAFPKASIDQLQQPSVVPQLNRLTIERSYTKCQPFSHPGHTFYSAFLNLSPCNYTPCPPSSAPPIRPLTHSRLVAGFSEASPRYMIWTALSLVKHPKQTLPPPIPAASRWPTNLATYTPSFSSSEWPCCIPAQSPRSCATT